MLKHFRVCTSVLFAALVLALGSISSAQDVSVRADGSAVYRWDSDVPITGSNHLVTSTPGTFTGADVANLIGANTFYSQGYTGSGTIISNIEAGHVWQGHETLGHVGRGVGDARIRSPRHLGRYDDRWARLADVSARYRL
jgi:hypothetical protein